MKTSNKILWGFTLCYAVAIGTTGVANMRAFERQKVSISLLHNQLAQSHIRVLVATGCGEPVISSWKQEGAQTQSIFLFGTIPAPEMLRISSDTLYLSGGIAPRLVLPYLETTFVDGLVSKHK
ncbi:MAG: hypothetical protein RRY23_06785 [Alistipes sp.]